MRRRVAAAMSAVSLIVVGFSVRASEQSGGTTSAAAAGVVDQPAGSPSGDASSTKPKPSTSPTPRSTPKSTPSSKPTSRAKPTPSSKPTPSTAAKTVTVNGAAVDTDYGPVQVQVSVRGKKIISATAIAYPQSSGRDMAINSYAIPMLQQDTVAKQSAQVDTVSGATYTSDGYRQSLQSALDAAHQAGAL
ncbi:FMN-binding protein [Kribbella alba]|uniref:FMN-binding protein n=1 Tax=Kribbella alba TaxID=190197 RepID=UPI0031D15155